MNHEPVTANGGKKLMLRKRYVAYLHQFFLQNSRQPCKVSTFLRINDEFNAVVFEKLAEGHHSLIDVIPVKNYECFHWLFSLMSSLKISSE